MHVHITTVTGIGIDGEIVADRDGIVTIRDDHAEFPKRLYRSAIADVRITDPRRD